MPSGVYKHYPYQGFQKGNQFAKENLHNRASFKKEKNPNWKGGRRISRGYVTILKPDYPFADKQGYVLEHRLIIEKHIGRYLTCGEVVHHINGNTADNRIKNLILFNGNGNHIRYEYGRATKPGGIIFDGSKVNK